MKHLKLIIAMGFFLSAGLLKAQSSQDPSLVAPQKDYHRDPQPVSTATAGHTAPANKEVTHNTGNGVKHTPRVIDPKESVYKKPAATK